MFELKPLSPENIEAALEKAERYRLLNESWECDSICRDVLAIDTTNTRATKLLIFAMTDRFDVDSDSDSDNDNDVAEAEALLDRLSSEYDRAFCAGIICERKGKMVFKYGGYESGPGVYRWLRKAMTWYERAEEVKTDQSDDAILRWNTCARMIDRHKHVRPPPGPPSGEWRIRDLTK